MTALLLDTMQMKFEQFKVIDITIKRLKEDAMKATSNRPKTHVQDNVISENNFFFFFFTVSAQTVLELRRMTLYSHYWPFELIVKLCELLYRRYGYYFKKRPFLFLTYV